MTASASPSPSRTRLIKALQSQDMALLPRRRGKAGGQTEGQMGGQMNGQEDAQIDSQIIGQMDKQVGPQTDTRWINRQAK